MTEARPPRVALTCLLAMLAVSTGLLQPEPVRADGYDYASSDGHSCHTGVEMAADRAHVFFTTSSQCNLPLKNAATYANLYQPDGLFASGGGWTGCSYYLDPNPQCGTQPLVSANEVRGTVQCGGAYREEVHVTLDLLEDGQSDPWVFFAPGFCVPWNLDSELICQYEKAVFAC
jgi:hypothetical protein